MGKERVNTHRLLEELKIIVIGVYISKRPITRNELIKKFGRPKIDKLMDRGYLCETIGNKSSRVKLTDLAKKEIQAYPPLLEPEREILHEAWSSGQPISAIALELGRASGDIVSKAHQEGFVRHDQFSGHVPSWRFRRIRLGLVFAERSAIDLNDKGTDLTHRAMKRRFKEARSLVLSAKEYESWTHEEIRDLRRFKDRQKSISWISYRLDKVPGDVAQQMAIDGRSLTGLFSEMEDEIIYRAISAGADVRKLANRLPNRTKAEIVLRARFLRGPNHTRISWNRAETYSAIEAQANGLKDNAMAQLLPGRSAQACRERVKKILEPSTYDRNLEDAEVQALVRGVSHGVPIKALALTLGLPEWAIDKRIHEFQLRKKGPTLKFCQKAIDVLIGISDRRGYRKKIQEEDLPKVRARQANGETMAAICADYRVSPSNMYKSFAEAGYSLSSLQK
jgi:hypothetical protein